MKTTTFFAVAVLLLLFLIPLVEARHDEEEPECGWTNIGECIPNILYSFLLGFVNAPVVPFLAGIEPLLNSTAATHLFVDVWSVIRYVLSSFYLFFFVYAGFVLLMGNAEPMKRAHAKEVIRDAVIMILLIQASFYIYNLALDLNSGLTYLMLSHTDPSFFMITIDNPANIALEIMLVLAYALTLLGSLVLLAIRYVVVSVGVVFFPIALFLYFLPPLRAYGQSLLHLLGLFIFITFFDAIIILASATLANYPLFANMKILVAIACFAMVNYTLWLAVKFAMNLSGFSGLKDDLKQAATYIAALVA